MNPSPIDFAPLPDTYEEENISMPLDFHTIQEQTLNAKKVKLPTKGKETTMRYEFTDKDIKQIEIYMKDMEKHIAKFAADGKDRFTYDCSKLNSAIYFELAEKFKTANPRFYVETHTGLQHLIVDWTGKNEC